MTRIMTYVVLVASLCLAASAGVTPGSISGYVRNTGGAPQMGATVQLVSAAGQLMIVHTDGKGYFSASGLTPGNYDVHVSAPVVSADLARRCCARRRSHARSSISP